MPELMRSVFNLNDKIRISPSVWPNCELDIQPGDLSKFALRGESFYGYQNQSQKDNPFFNAPKHEASSGSIIYFDSNIDKKDFEALMRIFKIRINKFSKKYAFFINEPKSSSRVSQDGYLIQMRAVSRFGLQRMFETIDNAEYENFPDQQGDVVEMLWLFIEHEQKCWGTSFDEDGKGLRGLFGGNGNSMREQLSFGFMVENDYYGIYRIWSRAYLVTK